MTSPPIAPPTPPPPLSGNTRIANLQRMASETFDVLVIGGGMTGAGVALDATLRGLKVALVERADFASGTSSRSSKMVHGGLRYLETYEFGLVRESLRERRLLHQRAPHLVHPLPILYPVYRSRFNLMRRKIAVGMTLYDLLGAGRAGKRHKWLRLAKVKQVAPELRLDGMVGAFAYRDDAVDDARLVMSVIRQAASLGAAVANYAPMVNLQQDGAGQVTGALIAPQGGQPIDVKASVVINAMGAWATQAYDGIDEDPGLRIIASKGIHVVVPRERLALPHTVFFHGRTGTNVFIEPWGEDHWVVGTTDEPYDGPYEDPTATEHEIARLLDQVNPSLREPLTPDDIVSSWAGLRPLVVPADEQSEAAQNSRNVSREHQVHSSPGLVSVMGGKLTTYRAMAEHVVGTAVKLLPRSQQVARCTTRGTPLIGAPKDLPALVDSLRAALGDERLARHLAGRYGTDALWIAERCRADSSLLQRLHPDRPYIAAEAEFARDHEMALHVDDVVHRRTRLAIETSDADVVAAPAVDALLGAAV